MRLHRSIDDLTAGGRRAGAFGADKPVFCSVDMAIGDAEGFEVSGGMVGGREDCEQGPWVLEGQLCGVIWYAEVSAA